MITLIDLIRRSGREPGGGLPKGYVETWTFSRGRGDRQYHRHFWEPFNPGHMFEFTTGLAVRDPKALERIHPFSLVDISKRRNP